MDSTAFSAQDTIIEVKDASDAWQAIDNVKTVSVSGATRPEIDVTHLRSDAREYLLGLRDEGSIDLEVDMKRAGLGQARLNTLLDSVDAEDFRITLPAGEGTFTFSARVQAFNWNLGVDAPVSGTYTLRITGAGVWS